MGMEDRVQEYARQKTGFVKSARYSVDLTKHKLRARICPKGPSYHESRRTQEDQQVRCRGSHR
jgi:hypothetical protein